MKIERSTMSILGVGVGLNEIEKHNINFESKLPTITNLLQMYSQRDLSVCGKILITKTFGISKILHQLSIIDVNKSFLDRLQSELNKYIWGYKPAKVKHHVLIGENIQGGLKSIDIKSKYKALRLSWVVRILNGNGWNDIIRYYVEPMGGLLFLLRCNYDTCRLNFLPTFYRNMLDYALEILYSENRCDIIWNNKSILIDGKSIYFREWHTKGVTYIQDLLNRDGTWMSFQQFSNNYKIKTNFLRYLGVLNAVKQASGRLWVDLSIKPNVDFESKVFKVSTGKYILLDKSKSRDFYDEFIDLILEPPAALQKWVRNYSLNEDIFYNSLILTKKSTSESKLLALQFKIIHNITNCRENLKRWNLSNDEICEFCDLKINDNLKHSLFECEFSKIIINEVFQLLSFQKERLSQIQCEEFIFGVEDSALNLVFLIIKKRLIEARTYKRKVSINSIENEILKRIYVDRMKMNICKFRRKWDNFPELVNQSCNYFAKWFISN